MYPSVSSSLTGRETAGAGLSNVAGYSSLTDSRFARADNNASPVPSTLSQQVKHFILYACICSYAIFYFDIYVNIIYIWK